MDNLEFDNALRDFVKSSELPFDSRQWDRMARRLKAHEDKKILPLPAKTIPLNRPVYKWASVAAAACLLVMLGWYIKGLEHKTNYTAQKTPVTTNTTTNDTRATEPQAEETTPAAAEAERIAAAPPRATNDRRTAPAAGTEKSVAPVVADVRPAEKPVVPAQEERKEQTTIAGDPLKQRKEEKSLSHMPVYEQGDQPDFAQPERKMAYGVNGGYNLGNGKGNFTVGVNVKRKLGKRLALEAGVAYVSANTRNFEERVTYSGITGQTSTRSYEPVKTNLHYLQAAPSLNYELLPGFSAGGGVDAQRLLSKPSESIAINSLGEQEAAQPQWDFGVTARMDYQVLKKLKAGVMYRESVGGISKNATETVKRNYLLMQLSYTLF